MYALCIFGVVMQKLEGYTQGYMMKLLCIFCHSFSSISYLFFCQIIFNTIAYETGLKERDFIVEINGTQVFDMNHDVCKDLIKQAGNTIKIKIER